MATYLDVYETFEDDGFIKRLAVACADVARGVFAEASSTPDYAVRRALVVYAGPSTQDFARFAKEISLVAMLVHGSLDRTSSDTVMKNAVTAIWTPYAKLLERKGVITVTP